MIHVGTRVDRIPGPKYTAALSFAEFAPRAPLPRVATLSRWRTQLPADFVLSLVAPAAARASGRGPLRFDPGMDAAYGWLVEAAQALAPAYLVLPTDAGVTTGQRDRDLIAQWFSRWPANQVRPQFVWAPTGLWEPELSAPFAAKLGVSLAVDPLLPGPLGGTPRYVLLRAIGQRSGFNEHDMRRTLEILGDVGRDACVVFDSPHSFREAKRFRSLLSPPE